MGQVSFNEDLEDRRNDIEHMRGGIDAALAKFNSQREPNDLKLKLEILKRVGASAERFLAAMERLNAAREHQRAALRK